MRGGNGLQNEISWYFPHINKDDAKVRLREEFKLQNLNKSDDPSTFLVRYPSKKTDTQVYTIDIISIQGKISHIPIHYSEDKYYLLSSIYPFFIFNIKNIFN